MAKSKNKYGQYFTIASVAEFMVTLIQHGKEASVLDPSCGQGIFIKMLQKNDFYNISAYEIDATLALDIPFVKHESFVSSPTNDKYDVIIGNPPYIRWKNLEPELKNELEQSTLWNCYFNSLCDYLFIFILKSIEQLSDDGELIFICPEYWMNTTHSKPLRDYMTRNGTFSDIFHFKEAPLFEGVTSSFVIFRYTKNTSNNYIKLHRYTQKGKPNLIDLTTGKCFAHTDIPQFNVGERWILTDRAEQNCIDLFEKSCAKECNIFGEISDIHRIGDVCDIGNGMVSGLDKAFKINDISVLNDFEKSQLICVYKAKDLNRYYNDSQNYYFFVKEPMNEEVFREKCPHIYSQLAPYSDDLGKRYNYGKNLKIWEFAFPRNENLFKRDEKRILIPCKERISHKNYFRFALAGSGVFPLQDVTGIFRKKSCREEIEYVLAYLNNTRVFKWLKCNGIVKGEIVEFSEAPVASIPYRPINWENATEVEIYNKIVTATKNYILTKDISYLLTVEQNFDTLFHGTN